MYSLKFHTLHLSNDLLIKFLLSANQFIKKTLLCKMAARTWLEAMNAGVGTTIIMSLDHELNFEPTQIST